MQHPRPPAVVEPVRLIGDPVLSSRAREVVEFGSDLVRLVDRMFAAMAAHGGVGLAAPQIGVPLRLFVVEYDDLSLAVANPVIEKARGVDVDLEGCLSIPGHAIPVVRATRVVLTGANVGGEPLRVELSGFPARIVQHELDHLDGVLTADRSESQGLLPEELRPLVVKRTLTL